MEQSAREVDAAGSSKSRSTGAAWPALPVNDGSTSEVFMMIRSEAGDWNLRVLDEPAQPGRLVYLAVVMAIAILKALIPLRPGDTVRNLRLCLEGATSWTSWSQHWGTSYEHRSLAPQSARRPRPGERMLCTGWTRPRAGGLCHGEGVDGGTSAARQMPRWQVFNAPLISGRRLAWARSLLAWVGM